MTSPPTFVLGEDPLRRLGEFELGREIGRGGMGVVYEAHQPSLDRRVALKVLPPSWVLDARQIVRFQNEARAAAALEHPHLVPVYTVGAEGSTHWYAMPLISGVSLKQVLRAMRAPDAPLDPMVAAVGRGIGALPAPQAGGGTTTTTGASWARRAAELMRQAATALAKAHSLGILHRDIKPGNLLVDATGHLWVADFGLAHFVRDGSDLTRSGEIVGTAAYSSPEQVGGRLAVDARSDVYSLGATLYELLTLRPPFAGGDPAAVARQVLSEEPAAVRAASPRVPDDLATIVHKALAKEPTARYQSASELAADLQAFLEHRPIQARPVTGVQRMGRHLVRWCRRRPTLAATLGVVVALLLSAGAAIVAAVRTARDRDLATARLASKVHEFDQLAGVVRLRRAQAEARNLCPPWPDRLPALRRWLEEEAGRLLAMQPEIEATLQRLRQRDFADAAQRFLHDTLAELHGKLVAFRANELCSVQERADWAARVGGLTLDHPRARTTWAAARSAIAKADGVVASPLYKEPPIDLAPQTGLVPIGMNPATLLWEFYELRSAWDREGDPGAIPIPQHVQDGDRRGHIEVGAGTGIVLVLLPGGTFTMGAQRDDPRGANHDPRAESDETPHRVTVAPFFLARHELTKAQWMRLSRGADPSRFLAGARFQGEPGAVTDWHPVEQVDWAACDRLLRLEGMTLPTEAQWEYGCRAGTHSPWWTGAEASSLAGAANVLDRHAESLYPELGKQEGDFDDGRGITAPVGSYRMNAFGLFDVHGNVFEWCADRYGSYGLPVAAGDGLRQVGGGASETRVVRGGGHNGPARFARSADRLLYEPTIRDVNLGLRAARAVQTGR